MKDEEIGCIETDFNTFKSEAKELLKEFNLVLKERGLYHNGLYKRTEQFLKENEE